MLWMIIAVLAVVAGAMALSRRNVDSALKEEPWRASLDEDEPLDIDEIRLAEQEWLNEEGEGEWDEDGDEDEDGLVPR